MKKLFGWLLSRWFLSGLGAAILAALVWLFGPLLAPLAGLVVRLAIIAVIALVWFGMNFWISRRRRDADAAIVAGATATAAEGPDASAEEVAALRDKLTTALGLLRRARGTRGYLYEQPWYVIIGPPGAGKTTALLNAGLQFPLASEMGQGAVAGIGGTRMCDWWFTENAVLIDTAGRYTTQDSDAAVDRAGWEGFLDLLRRTRARQPLNGVLVAISVADIATAPAAERSAHARAIRRRVKELTDRLGVRLPVYALFTKADLLAGFTEYFDDLDRERRGQVWGMTFPIAAGEAGPVPGFAAEFQALVSRLGERLLDRLQAERSPDRRALIAGFPAQVASLEQPLTSFLTEAFGGSRLDPAPFLRGAYLTSGTQEGTPIDRLTGALARAFGVDQRRAPSLRPEQGRSYFLTRLLRDVVFGEAMLVSARPGAARRQALLRGGAFAAIALLTIGVVAGLWTQNASSNAEIARAQAALAAYSAAAAKLPLDPVNDANLAAIAPLLDQARALPDGYDHPASGAGLGLSQSAKIGTASRAVYRQALERVLLPRLIWRLEGQIRGNLDKPEFTYEATRVYLMLGNQGPLDRGLVREWMTLDWQNTYPGAADAPLRGDLVKHLDALLANPLPQVPLDGKLIEDARRTFSRVSLAERVYSRIRPLAANVPPWTPGGALGASGAPLFVRASGKPLTDGIPGLYTRDGFYKVVLPSLPVAAKEVASESWVLGASAQINPTSPETANLEHDVVALYTAEYIKAWEAMLADLNLAPLNSLNEAVRELYVLGSPQSPMRDLLASVANQLTLSVPPKPVPGAEAAAKGAAAALAPKLGGAASQLQGLLGKQGGPPPAPPGLDVDNHFKALIDFVGKGPGAPIDTDIKLINDLQQQLSQVAATPAGGAPAPALAAGGDPGQLLIAAASQAPAPVSRWLPALASSASVLRGGGAKAQVAAAFNGGGGPGTLCQRAVNGRYPFFAGASSEIPLDDFARLFAPNGLLDSFFNTQLRPFVDTSGTVWKAQAANGVPPPITAGDLAQFQRASQIRDMFFAAGGTTPTVRFDITPVTLDAGAKQVSIDFGGVAVVNAHGPVQSTPITWPGPNRMDHVRLVFDPPAPGTTGVIEAHGPWALFRLFDQGEIARGGAAERYTLTFHLGARSASFDLRADSVLNPFAPGVLHDFRCPAVH
jgi:type VI secretion system protein ImpL